MTFRRLPRTVREVLATLRRQFGVPGLIVGLIALPFVLVAAIISFPFVGIVRRMRRSAPAGTCTLEIGRDNLLFSWAGDAPRCRRALDDAVRVLIDSLPELLSAAEIETLEIRNPETGFALDPERLELISTDHARKLARLLWGEKLEYGELLVNGQTVLGGLDVDTRSRIAGHLGIDIPGQKSLDAVVARAEERGFGVLA